MCMQKLVKIGSVLSEIQVATSWGHGGHRPRGSPVSRPQDHSPAGRATLPVGNAGRDIEARAVHAARVSRATLQVSSGKTTGARCEAGRVHRPRSVWTSPRRKRRARERGKGGEQKPGGEVPRAWFPLSTAETSGGRLRAARGTKFPRLSESRATLEAHSGKTTGARCEAGSVCEGFLGRVFTSPVHPN